MNETTGHVHGKLYREGEDIIEFHPQYFNNHKTVTSTVELEHSKTNHNDSVRPANCSLRHPSEGLNMSLPIKGTESIGLGGCPGRSYSSLGA